MLLLLRFVVVVVVVGGGGGGAGGDDDKNLGRQKIYIDWNESIKRHLPALWYS